MSLELAAQHLASRGRKGDSMLVHMAPEEVSGLQALARAGGGTLTLNPDTGLPEANFLKRMLPMLIGAGITAATGGAAAPWMIGLGMGGVETLRTGNLGKGLMAGLGAYGGAGVAGGLLGAGAGAAQQTAMAGVGEGASQAAMNQAARVATDQAIASPLSTMGAGIQGLGTEAGRSAALSSMGGGAQAAKYGLAALSPTMQPEAAKPFDGGGPNPYEFDYDPATQRYTRVPTGTRQRDILAPTTQMAADGGMMDSGPIESMSARNEYETMMANGGQRFAAGGQVNLQGTFTAGDQGGGGPFGQANANGYQAAGSGGPITGFSSSFGQMGGGDANMMSNMGGNTRGGSLFSGGFGAPGQIDPRAVQADPEGFQRWQQMSQQREQQMPGSTMLGGGIPGQQQALIGGLGGYGQAMRALGSFAAGGMASMAQGGPSHLGDYSDGGRLLKGPGNGTSDDIPATIADKRPARLADGEFVIPSRIVSELGNGSTEAGARQLYAMMDRVQKARAKTTGKNKVAFDAKARNLLPA